MKKIITKNGSTIVAYEYDDLTQSAKDNAIEDHIHFEVEVMSQDSPYYYLAEKMMEMETPWFLQEEIYSNHLSDIEETIRINNYLFDEDGDHLPICYHTKGSKVVKTTYKSRDCEIIDLPTKKL